MARAGKGGGRRMGGSVARSMQAHLSSGRGGPKARAPKAPAGKGALPPSASKKPNQKPFPLRGYA